MTRTDFVLGIVSSLIASILYTLGSRGYTKLISKSVHIWIPKNLTTKSVLPVLISVITLAILVNPLHTVLAPNVHPKSLKAEIRTTQVQRHIGVVDKIPAHPRKPITAYYIPFTGNR
jgi:hypothetical protein